MGSGLGEFNCEGRWLGGVVRKVNDHMKYKWVVGEGI